MGKRAIATHFLGRLKDAYDVQTPLLQALRIVAHPHYYSLTLRHAIAFEVVYALCGVPSPQVWEMMIDLFLTLPDSFLEGDLPDWIACLTDRLSGSETDTRHEWQWKNLEERMQLYTRDELQTHELFYQGSTHGSGT